MLSSALGWMALLLGLIPAQARGAAKAPTTYRISGIVVDAVSGQPVPRAELFLYRGSTEPSDVIGTVMSGSCGEFAFENVAPGKYTLRAQRRGYAPQAYLQHENYWTGIVVGPGVDAEKIRFPLLPSASISGQVVDEYGEAMRNAKVLLFEQGVLEGKRTTRMSEQVMTDDEGRYRFGHLLPGDYLVGVNAEPWYHMSLGQFRVAAGGEVRELASNMDFSLDLSSSTNSLPDVVYPMTFFPDARDISAAEIFHLHAGDGEIADVRLQQVPAFRLHVRVPSNGENTNSNVIVFQSLADGLQVPVQGLRNTSSPGVMEVSGLPPGHLDIWVTSPATPDRAGTSHVESVDLSSNLEMDATRPSVQRNVSGVVKMEDGTDLPSVTAVQLRDTKAGVPFVTRIRPGGEFSFENNPISGTTGSFEVSMVQSQDVFVRRVLAKGAKVSGARVEFGDDQDIRLEIMLAKGTNSINGLALRENKPIAGAMIVLLPEDFQNNVQLIRRDQTDSDGSFTLRQVPSGHYTMLAIANGWELEWMNPEVLRKYLPDGTSVDVPAEAAEPIKVKAQ